MSEVAVRGWCPTAWRPMAAGDGLIVRVRPRFARLTRAQALGLCDAALRFGNGMIDATSRANVQIRGVSEQGWPALLDALIALDLIDADPVAEARRTMLVAPDWTAGDDTDHIAAMLMARVGELPDLPAKMGFGIDAGPAPILTFDAADFRVERGESGGLILRVDGREQGMAVTREAAVRGLIALAHWFVDSGGMEAGRMARYRAPLPGWAVGRERPASSRAAIVPGEHALGSACGVAFGSMAASSLIALIERSGAEAVRITPWRVLLLEGGAAVEDADEFVFDPAPPLLRAEACPGAPVCPQATVATRSLARALVPHVAGRLHVAGCAKGCAHAGPAAVMLTGRDGLYDLAFDARAGDAPAHEGLSREALFAVLGAG